MMLMQGTHTAIKPHATYYQDCQPIPNQPQKGLAATLALILTRPHLSK